MLYFFAMLTYVNFDPMQMTGPQIVGVTSREDWLSPLRIVQNLFPLFHFLITLVQQRGQLHPEEYPNTPLKGAIGGVTCWPLQVGKINPHAFTSTLGDIIKLH